MFCGRRVGLTPHRADLVGDGVSQDVLLLDVHQEHPLHGDLQRLRRGAAVVVTTVAVGDVLLQLEGEGLGAALRRRHRELPHGGGGDDWGERDAGGKVFFLRAR